MSASESPLEINLLVTQATVFTDRAILIRSGSAELPLGHHTATLMHLPDNLDEESVRVTGQGTASVTIEDFKIQRKHFRDVPEERIQTLIAGKEELQKERKALVDTAEVIASQEAFLQGINLQSSENISVNLKRKSPSIDEWKSVLEFLGGEGNALKSQSRDVQAEIDRIDKEIALINKSLQGVANAKGKVRKQVLVEIDVAREGAFTFEVSYMIRNASWKPMYDARVDAKTKEVQLRYYGAVTQRTGEDWNQVRVLLSTARPYIGGNAPELYEWKLGFRPEMFGGAVAAGPPRPQARSKSKKRAAAAPAAMAMDAELQEESAVFQSAEVVGGEGASVVFSPPGKSDVPGDGSTGKLLVMQSPFQGEFEYLAIPKLTPHVYLTAKVKNSTEYPLLPGSISIFLDGNFVGKSHLTDLVTTGEKFSLSLGVDEAIKVKHKLKRKFGDEKGLFTKSKVTEYAYQIDLDNQHDRSETITLRDQIPVSEEDDIKVKLERIQPAEHADKKTDELPAGTLEWKIEVQARQKAQIEFEFSVSHGKDAKITGL